MRNWQIILWLLLFFPVGIYLMFTYSDWKKPVKFTVTGFFIVLLFVGGIDLWASLLFLGAFFAIIVGLFTVFRSKTRRRGVITLTLGVLAVTATYPIVDAQTAEVARLEQIELEAQAEADRIAEEERLEEVARKEEEERLKEEEQRLKEEEQLKEEIVEAIEVAEAYPTQENYDYALELLEQLETPDRLLAARLDELLPGVGEYEKKVAAAKEAVDQAEKAKNREAYDAAYELVSALPISNTSLTRRLSKLDDEIVKIEEEERRAAEKAAEEERKAAEKAAEEERKAAEKAAEEERIAAEKAAEEERKAAEKAAEEQRIAAEQEAKKQAEANAQQAAGSSNSGNSNNNSGNNSSNNAAESSSQAPAPAPVSVPGEYVDASGNGLIKGSSSGIYHVPGSTYYERTTSPVAWFRTVQEAVNAGYRAPKR